ncbi:receptor-type tyrosine-protein phosphatase eta-like [Watersipora subatra]|uniref:receptor-type tyrosine-protein phosphatase eta-like n=1 Tax=Watersipora subatra TaxID=2589382 RepID=UPI00355B1816
MSKAPNNINCNEQPQYRYDITPGNVSPWQQELTGSFYLDGDVSYDFGVRARNNAGNSNWVFIQGRSDALSPEIPRFNVIPFRNSSASLNISFEESNPYCDSITYYVITVSRDGSLAYNDTTETYGIIVIHDLQGFTNYSVVITAVNNANLKKESIQYILTSETDRPGKPNIIAIHSTSDSVSINVTQPEVPNGIIKGYALSCYTSPKKWIMLSDGNAFGNFSGLPSATKINCSVKAENSVGPGNAATAHSYTQLKYGLCEYLVMLSEQSREKRSSTEATCPQVSAKNCYVAKTIPATEIGSEYKFIAGDGSEGNPSLNFGATYDVYLAVRVLVEEGYEPLIMVFEPQTVTAPSELNSTGAIAGGVVGTLALLAIGGTIFLIWRHRRHSANNGKKDVKVSTELYCLDEGEGSPSEDVSAPSGVPNQPIASASNSLPFTADGDQANDEMLYENPTRSEDRTKAIAIDELEFHIKTNIELIEEQYTVELHQVPAPTMNAALTAENKGKCRYKGLYPSDKYRVCLERTDPNESDFINASIMKGYSREAQYIAAQGPFTDTVVNDFWLMIWQQQPSAIVMVTRAIEQTKMKCKQYWPLCKGHVKVFGEFQVELKASETYSDFSMNQLKVTLNGKSRIIPHFNYLAWPDHGVPDIEVFVSFHRLVTTTINHTSNRPLLVHCRSDTNIALISPINSCACMC